MFSLETHLANRNHNWQTIGTALQSQSERTPSIEGQIIKLNTLKQNMTSIQITADSLDKEVSQVTGKVQEHENAIQVYSNMWDDVKADHRHSYKIISDLQAPKKS